MENKDIKFIINTIEGKTKYPLKSIEQALDCDDSGEQYEIRFKTPEDTYLVVFFNIISKEIYLTYCKDILRSSSIDADNFGKPEIPYQKCLSKFLTIVN